MIKKRFLMIAAGLLLSVSLVGCASRGASVNRGNEEEEVVLKQRPVKEESDMPKQRYAGVDWETIDCASVKVEFKNTDMLAKRDILVFRTIDTSEILGAVKTNGHIFETELPPDEYYICSGFLEPTEMKVKNAKQKFIIKVDYKEKTLEIIEE